MNTIIAGVDMMVEIIRAWTWLGYWDVPGWVRIFSAFNFVCLIIIMITGRRAHKRTHEILREKLIIDEPTFEKGLETLVVSMKKLNEFQLLRGKQTEELTAATSSVRASTDIMIKSLDLLGTDVTAMTNTMRSKLDEINQRLDAMK
jgi:hypothetical protein